MVSLPEIREVRLSTELAIIAIVIIWSGVSLYSFNYFAGAVSNPTDLAVASLDQLSQPPVIQYPSNDPPANITSPLPFSQPATSKTLVCYQTWFFWPGNSLHAANDWEPVYIIWDTAPNTTGLTGLLSARLLAVITRFHAVGATSFSWVTRTNNFFLNGTQPIIKFSVGFHIPLTGTTTLFPLKGILYSGPYTTAANYNYTVDPNSPPATGPSAYQPGSGPADCFTLYGSPTSTYAGIFWGSITLIAGIVASTIAFFGVRWILEKLHDFGLPLPFAD